MSAWKSNHLRLFVSHVSAQKDVAQQLKEWLANFQIDVFVAHSDIQPTQEWQSVIENSLGTMDALVALLTPGFHESKWTDQEIGFALGRGTPIIPIRFGIDPYGFIGKIQSYQIGEKPFGQIAQDMFRIITKNESLAPRLAAAFIARLEQSDGYAEAKRTMTLLEQCAIIDLMSLSTLECVVRNKGQVRSAWGVPERVEVLVQRHREAHAAT